MHKLVSFFPRFLRGGVIYYTMIMEINGCNNNRCLIISNLNIIYVFIIGEQRTSLILCTSRDCIGDELGKIQDIMLHKYCNLEKVCNFKSHEKSIS